MNPIPKPVDRESGEEVEAAPLLESGNGSLEPGSEEEDEAERAKLTSPEASNKRIAPCSRGEPRRESGR